MQPILMNASSRISRRNALARISAGTFVASLLPMQNLAAARHSKPGIRIGACDWSLGRTANPEAFDVAREIGLDGVQVSLGTAADNMRMRTTEAQRQVMERSRKTGVQVASLAIGELNVVPYKSNPATIPWVEDSIDTCKSMGANVVLLAFFSKNDLRNDPEGTNEVVKRLQAVAPKAEKHGIILGIESWLSAEQHLQIIDRVGSTAVKVYYDVCNSTDRGYDIFKEIRILGRDRIFEFHAKENGALLGKGKVDFNMVRKAMDAIGYSGWIQIEGAVPAGANLIESYKRNCDFLRKTFALT